MIFIPCVQTARCVLGAMALLAKSVDISRNRQTKITETENSRCVQVRQNGMPVRIFRETSV